MAAVCLQTYFPSIIAYKYMLSNIDMKQNKINQPGEANTASSRLRMAFSHMFQIRKWLQGHLDLNTRCCQDGRHLASIQIILFYFRANQSVILLLILYATFWMRSMWSCTVCNSKSIVHEWLHWERNIGVCRAAFDDSKYVTTWTQ